MDEEDIISPGKTDYKRINKQIYDITNSLCIFFRPLATYRISRQRIQAVDCWTTLALQYGNREEL